MDIEMFEENLETTVEASDILSVPEGAKEFVDIIGDEKLDGYGNPASNFDTQQRT
ncbi:hypothetical protein [Paenibacillus sp. Soil787]|uniref:hypothetical protein n=1 Tax=Paenibacillus sp. Soil787 TaxID=1736411 RepID=UPI000B062CA0|nr:hypothetical protein [Paenibacillus sp. Soil787]